MGIDDKAKNAAKDAEGKMQNAYGKVTDNKEAQAKGKAKQAEAKVRSEGEKAKDNIKDAID